jgi:hypothetical protein
MIVRLLRTVAKIEGGKVKTEHWQPLFACVPVR